MDLWIYLKYTHMHANKYAFIHTNIYTFSLIKWLLQISYLSGLTRVQSCAQSWRCLAELNCLQRGNVSVYLYLYVCMCLYDRWSGPHTIDSNSASGLGRVHRCIRRRNVQYIHANFGCRRHTSTPGMRTLTRSYIYMHAYIHVTHASLKIHTYVYIYIHTYIH